MESASQVAQGISVLDTPIPGPLGPNAINPTEYSEEMRVSRPHLIDSSNEVPLFFILSYTLFLKRALVIASPIPVAATARQSSAQKPEPGSGTSPTLPGGR